MATSDSLLREGIGQFGLQCNQWFRRDLERPSVHAPGPTKRWLLLYYWYDYITYYGMLWFKGIVYQRQYVWITPSISVKSWAWLHLRSLNTFLSVLSCNIVRLSSKVSIFWGGSRMAKRGLRLGRTVLANWDGDNDWDIAKTFGRIYGNRWTSFI